MTSLGLLRCETWADPSVTRRKNVGGNRSRIGRSRTEAEICEAGVPGNGSAKVLRNVSVPLPDTILPYPQRVYPLGTVRPLYRTAVSLLSRERFLYF